MEQHSEWRVHTRRLCAPACQAGRSRLLLAGRTVGVACCRGGWHWPDGVGLGLAAVYLICCALNFRSGGAEAPAYPENGPAQCVAGATGERKRRDDHLPGGPASLNQVDRRREAHNGAVSARDNRPELYARVERQLPELVRSMVKAFAADVPIYGELPAEQLAGEITGVVNDNLRLFFRLLREGRDPNDEEMVAMRHSAARRAEERIPLDAVLAAYHLGGRMGWQALVAAATPEETPALVAAAGRLLSYVQAVTAAVFAAYLEEQQAIYGEQREAYRALAQALLSGREAEALAARLGTPLADCYVVLCCHIDEHPDEQDSVVMAAVAGRRKLRRVTDRLAAFAGAPVASLLTSAGGTVLLPAQLSGLGVRLGEMGRLVTELQSAAGAALTAAVCAAEERGRVPAAATQAREVLRLARALGLAPGCYQLSDVLLEYQLTRGSDAQPMLAALLDPLQRNPDLFDTLRSYLANNLDRRQTAADLHVHPNTLDYRLRRVGELTSLDIGSTRGIQLAAASLAARQLLSIAE